MKNTASTGTNRENARYYVAGSAARQLSPREQEYVREDYGRSREQVRRRALLQRRIVKAAPMNMGYIAVMMAALLSVCVVLMSYIKLQSDITNHVNNISALESRLNELKLENDETYTKIMSSVDLEDIKRIAVNELGMKYAKEGQVVQYTGEGNDYVRQYSDIPQQ
ncbi:MAG: cell division protein FtsL [Lachnospiraceae bacterium]|nr:cell division protein FtsL [Lachnospiraceae bacterium]